MARYFHVSSTRNRDSISRHGLDPSRMGAAPGIAGSQEPEADGVFLIVSEWEAESFGGWINNTGGQLDLWAADNVDPEALVDNGNGYEYLPGRISPADVEFLGELPPHANPINRD